MAYHAITFSFFNLSTFPKPRARNPPMSQDLPTIRLCTADVPSDARDPHSFLPDLDQVCKPVIDERNPQLIIYSCFSRNFRRLPETARRLFICLENVHPNFNECDYAIACQPMTFGDRYLRVAPWEYGFNLEGINDRAPFLSETKTRFCNFIYSNNKSRYIGTQDRLNFCRELMNYKQVDCPGRVLHNMEAPELDGRYTNSRSASKIAFTRAYKFTIAWENTYGEGYCTEKLIEPLMAGSVPIYKGSLPECINPKSVINVDDFADTASLIDYIRYLDENDEAYRAVLAEKPLLDGYKLNWRERVRDFLRHIIEHIDEPRCRAPFRRDTEWLMLKEAGFLGRAGMAVTQALRRLSKRKG